MAVYQFSALSDGQAISFNASLDVLNFDQTVIAAGDLALSQEGGGVRVMVKSGPQAGKDVLLTGFSLEQIAASNFTFADGSFARVGDNNVGTAGDAGNNALSGGAGRDLLMGLGGNDNLQAGDNNDSVVGGAGNDTVSGNNGNDWLTGGTGNDTLNGGGGQDSFVLNETGTANADLLADFATGWDNIQLDAAALTQIGAAGRFAAGDARFRAGSAAQDADDRIIYNSATQQIFYDADGNGAGAAQLIGTVSAGRTVTATDFWVFGEAGGGGGGNTINGTAGNDTLNGTDGNDTINGLGGNDSLFGGLGLDSLNGGDGNDTLNGVDSPFLADQVTDTLDGGLGNDLYFVRETDVILADTGGIDTVDAFNTDWTLGAGLENLDLSDSGTSVDGTGNELDNVIRSASEGGTLSGLDGDDLLIARHVQNTVTLLGGNGNDTLDGSGGTTNMDGGAGNDLLIAGGGGLGSQMTGGTGADSFLFVSQESISFIADFSSGEDKLRFDGQVFTQIGASGNFVAGDARFFAGSGAA